MDRLTRLAWFTLGWGILTVLLGALVRATHSGAGCGRSWPTCQGQLVPELGGATTIEFVHRSASGVMLALAAVLAVAVWRRRKAGHPARAAAGWVLGLTIGEALIGAAIVLYEWVADDASVARVVSVPLHLANTFLLLGAITLTAWFLAGGGRLHRRGPARRWLIGGAVALVMIAATGSVTALADTLFPAAAVAGSPAAASSEHFLTRLRIIHPVLAVVTLVFAATALRRAASLVLPRLRPLVSLTALQMVLGVSTIAWGSPLWLRLLHLLVADLIWVIFVWLGAQVLASSSSSAVASATGARQVNPLQR
jgi:cytochrome c oxidase assembly protein subunit 15